MHVHAFADESIKFGYVVRPGMAEIIDGEPTGTYLPLASEIANAAQLQVQWEELPQIRLIAQVRANFANYCAVGIYKNIERTTYAKFSHAFFRDKPLVVITLKSKEAQIRKHASFAKLAADTSLKIGLLEGYSYGAHLDAIVWNMRNSDRMSGSTIQNKAKLAAGRFDYILGSNEEALYIANSHAPDDRNMVKIEFADLAPGETRHFMCSAAVSDATIARLNAAIHALHLDIAPEER